MLSECEYAASRSMQREADVLLWRSLGVTVAAWLVARMAARMAAKHILPIFAGDLEAPGAFAAALSASVGALGYR